MKSLSSDQDMEIDQFLVNSKGEAFNLDEFSDLEPILAEIFSSDISQCNPIDAQQPSKKSEAEQLSCHSRWSSYITGPQLQEICIKPSPSSSASSSSSPSSSSQLISFGNSKQTDEKLHRILARDSSISSKIINFSSLTTKQTSAHEMGSKRVCTIIRSPLQAQDHVISERRRREKLSQLFIALSKVVPGLKKLDKASLLGDAVKYVQELQERVRILEDEVENKNSITKSSPANYSATINNDTSSSKESSNGNRRESVLAEIKARISNNNVLIKICYKKHKGLISRIQYEMEKLHLNVLDIRAIPFGSSTLDITILAEMKDKFCWTVEDIVGRLEVAFLSSQA